MSLLLQPVCASPQLAFTQTNPGFPSSSFDAIQIGEMGAFTTLPLPAGLEFPWDIDYCPTTDRLFVAGAGQDDGTAPPNREFISDNRGSIWSFNLDGSDPVQHAAGLNRSVYIDVTPDGQTVFFSEEGEGEGSGFQNNGRVARLDVATNTIETVVTAPPNGGATGLDYDPATGDVLYYVLNRGTDFSLQQIRRVSGSATDLPAGGDELFLENPLPDDGVLDEASEFTVLSSGRNVSVFGGFVYFTYRNGAFAPPSEIRRIPIDFDLDTDDPESFETVVGPVTNGQLIVDFEIFDDALFWTDPQQNQLFSVALGIDGLPASGASPVSVAQGDPTFASVPLGVGVIGIGCPADLNGDGKVDASDLAMLLGDWSGDSAADLDGSGAVGADDLAILLGSWGLCP